MPITNNVGGVKKVLSTITTNTGVKKVLDTVTANDGGVKRVIHSSNFVSFQELNKNSLASGGLTNAQCIKGDKVTVSFTAKSAKQTMDSCYTIRIWVNNIKSGDKVVMCCSYTRSSSGYYIASKHYNADGTVAATNGKTDDGLYGSGGSYTVDYTSTTDKNFIDISMGYNVDTTLVFNILVLKINGRDFLGQMPVVTFSTVDEDSSDGVYKYLRGGLSVYAHCSSKNKSCQAVSDPFEWVNSSHRLSMDMSVCLGSYTFHPSGAPSGTTATSGIGSASIVLIDNTTGKTTSLLVANNYTSSNKSGDIDASLFTVGHSYSIGIYSNQTNGPTSVDSYAYAQAICIYVH